MKQTESFWDEKESFLDKLKRNPIILNTRIKISSFIQGLKNIYEWFPLVWKDRDYDHAYINYMLLFKLKRMKKRMEKGGILADHEYKRILSKMNIAINLLEKINEDFYDIEHYNYINYEWKFNKIEDRDLYSMETEYSEDRLDEYFTKYKRKYNILKKDFDLTDIDSRVSLASKIADLNHSKSREIFYKLLDRYEEGWWD